MSSLITNITIEDFANAEIIHSNTLQTDVFSSRYNGDIRIVSDLIPQIDSTLEFGNANFRLSSICSNDITSNTFRPEDSQTITFFGNLHPSVDNVFDLGIASKRWKQIRVNDLIVTGSTTLGDLLLIDANTFIQDDIDSTKKFQFQASPITTGTTRTFTVPNADTTLVGTDVSQTLTNKTITGTTNTVRATQLATTGSDVIINTAIPPITNQIIIATTPTSAYWGNASTLLMGSAITDNQFVSAFSLTTTNSSLLSNIDDMSITTMVPNATSPYLILFNATCSTSNNNTSLDFSFAIDGLAVTGTVIRVTPETKDRNVTVIFSTTGITNGQVITAQWRISNGAGSGNITFREMLILGFGTQ